MNTITIDSGLAFTLGKCYLDDVHQTRVVEANWVDGWVRRYKLNDNGKVLVSITGVPDLELVYGKVKIVLETANAS